VNDERRPEAPHEIPATASTVSVPQPADTDLQPPELTPLARLLIGRVPPGQGCPRYGTDEWHALPDQDPRRAAAVMRAAEAWRRHCSPWQVAQDMRDSLAEIRDVIAYTFVQTSHDVAEAEAADWDAIFDRPTFAELCDRRGEPERAERARERWAS
jgi:hypothetical protein